MSQGPSDWPVWLVAIAVAILVFYAILILTGQVQS